MRLGVGESGLFPEPVGLWPRARPAEKLCLVLCRSAAPLHPLGCGDRDGVKRGSYLSSVAEEKPQRGSKAKNFKRTWEQCPHLTERNAEALAGGGSTSSSHSSSLLRTSVCVGTVSLPPSHRKLQTRDGLSLYNKPQGLAPLNLSVLGGATYLL